MPEDVAFIYSLGRADGENKKSVAVIEGKKDGSVILNPRHNYGRYKVFDYGPIPELQKFDLKTANRLYGSPISSKKVDSKITENSYRFLVRHSEKSLVPKKEVFLDFRFEELKLKQYRVRIIPDFSSSWKQV